MLVNPASIATAGVKTPKDSKKKKLKNNITIVPVIV